MTDNMNASTINDLLRSLASWLIDRPAYLLLGWMYEIFFNVASAELFTNETVKNFYYRVQLIIGVFMIFKLAVSILQGIMNPDKVTDKQAGMGNMITRVIISLAMLTVLVPINIPNAQNEYEIELNNNGLLFGTLYSLQNRVLSTNTLGRLILGTTDDATDSADKQGNKLKQSANIFASTILKGFIRINTIPEDLQTTPEGGKDPATLNENRVCQDMSDDVLKLYTSLDANPQDVLGLVNIGCTASKDASWWGESLFNKAVSGIKKLAGAERYAFSYIPLLGGIVAFVFAFILLGFTVDIAVRAVKLAVLRLIAPIPIISYIDPKSAKDGAFASWVKAVTSTYLDIFIRLAIIYFVIFLIQDMIVNGIVINTGGGFIGVISFIFICLGLFIFARQAPKFIKDTLGLKGNMSNIGLSAMLGGTAMLAGGGGLRGFAQGALQGAEGSIQGYNQGKPQSLGSAWSQNRDMMAKIRTGDKDAKGGIIGSSLDRLNYETRERNAEKLGYGKSNKAKAEWNKKQLQSLAGNASDEFEDAKIAYDTYLQTADKSEPMYSAVLEQKAQAVRNARAKKSKADIDFQKASGAADKIDKYRAQLGAAPRISDIPRQTYRSEERINDTATNDPRTTGYNMDEHGEFDPNRVDDFIVPGNEPFDAFKGSTHAAGKGSSGNTTVDDSTYSSSHNGPDGPGGPPPM